MKLKRKGEEREVNGGVRLISLFNFDFWLHEGGRRRVGDPWALWGFGPTVKFQTRRWVIFSATLRHAHQS